MHEKSCEYKNIQKLNMIISKLIDSIEDDINEIEYLEEKVKIKLKKNITDRLDKLLKIIKLVKKLSEDSVLDSNNSDSDQQIIARYIKQHGNLLNKIS